MMMKKTDQEWQAVLTPFEYEVTRKKGTEPAFSGKYYENQTAGTYLCRCCLDPLFDTNQQYDSGSGWPSFYQPKNPENIQEQRDPSLRMERTEVLCKSCGAHLGHVFKDGPQPTGLRYCINSVSLKLQPRT